MSHVDEGTLHAYLDGELPAPERERWAVHIAACAECRTRLEEERALGCGQLRPLERHGDRFDEHRRSLFDVDDRADLVPLGGQLDVVVDAGMVVTPVAVQLPQLLEIGAEGERLEGGQRPPELPEFVPAARLRRHRLSQVVGGDRLVAVEDEGSEAPLAARLERIELHRARPWGQQRDESERERRPPAPAGGSPGPPPPAHARTIA